MAKTVYILEYFSKVQGGWVPSGDKTEYTSRKKADIAARDKVKSGLFSLEYRAVEKP